MEVEKESELNNSPKVIKYESIKKIIEQMEKNICRIVTEKLPEKKSEKESDKESEIAPIQEQGTGFFCKIPFPNITNKLTVHITNYHVINEDLLDNKGKTTIYIQNEKEGREMNFKNRMCYTNEEYDITIIEIKEKDNIKNYLELDDEIMKVVLNDDNDNDNFGYRKKTVYIIQYPENELSVSFGLIDSIEDGKEKYNFYHKCYTNNGSSGSPILNSENNKVIGVHKSGTNVNVNKGVFLDKPIKEFIRLNCTKIPDKNIDLNIDNSYKENLKNGSKNNFQANNGNIKEENMNNIRDNHLDKEKDNNVVNPDIYNIMNEQSFKEFCRKYNINNATGLINLNKNLIENEGVKYLSKVELKELKQLYLQNNNISDINPFEIAKFENLQKLDIGNNEISDINILGKVNFLRLKELYLFHNNISDIRVFEKVKFERLEILNLGDNKISDIKAIEKTNIKGLKQLFLYGNIISDISPLKKFNLQKLIILNIGDNKISDISILENTNFKELKELFLYGNHISDIEVLANLNFDKLEKLDLGRNIISDINVLEQVSLKELKQLFLYNNKISDIKVIDRINLENLELINLRENGIIKGSMSYRFIIEI